MKKIGVQKIGINKLAINRKIGGGGPVMDDKPCCNCDPGPYGWTPDCPSVCNPHGCAKHAGIKSRPGDLISNPARRMNIARVQRRVR